VVDDEPVLAEQLRTIFALDGHEVAVREGEEALAALKTRKFDRVLTDLGMPGVTGWDVASEAKSQLRDVRVGLVTGWAEELDDPEHLAPRGVDSSSRNPHRVQQMRAATAEALRRSPVAQPSPALAQRCSPRMDPHKGWGLDSRFTSRARAVELNDCLSPQVPLATPANNKTEE